ncbi:TonB-dependent receptor plug domain-containing protein [Reichenbachiella carrageenanivorans]|uniref:TonB-dependent receptor plug domain-containing protein n=1 Tax=Reichenbachiella carrageenanivorans TaxID=2979869 RepID=A0ABY6CY43_9BACT|nr:TonB-dependent receptor [Reichenbachiella carrageenanivorans]UXX78289.1 TonB-dependent receptor plug domain-containing protein [Reichenbachiella carrageenanivorans]
MKLTNKFLIGSIFCMSILMSPNLYGQEDDSIFDMSLEDLMNIEITSVSKKAERLQDVSSSIYVVTSKDIEHSGATTLHEVLRLVPGYWGVQDEYSNAESNIRYSQVTNGLTGTVLYLLDGTPIQDLMASSFSFRNFDIPLDEIDRIEVIRGSGGTIYGANSATGVVNIFTKNPDQYDGINARAEAASAGYVATSIRAGGAISEDFSVSGYAKMRLFDGFGSLAGTDQNGNQVIANSRFTEDYDNIDMYSFGLKAKYKLSENGTLSLNSHFNTLKTIDYSSYYGSDFALSGDDVLVQQDVTDNRLVGNLRYDHTFSDNHSLFVRASTNIENNFQKLAGGFEVSNGTYDFEIQDNISLGDFNDLSAGINYRINKFDVHNINNPSSVNYSDPQSSESLKGAFIQDKIKLAGGKVNLLLGIKAENYSLVNDEYYLSPMAKISYLPTENWTFWGGFTQSFSTPGFNNTNIDLFLYQAPTDAEWNGAATQVVYQDVYDTAISNGADDATATAQAQAFVTSPTGLGTITATEQFMKSQNPQATTSTAVKNGSHTVPTRFRTWEIGFRGNIENQLTFESNFYHTTIKDGIGISPDEAATIQESTTQPDRMALYYLYGNYVQGTTLGTESTVKIIPVNGVVFEMTHSYLQSTWEQQENPDFTTTGRDLTPSVSKVPSHIFRFKGDFELPKQINLSASMIYGTQFNTQGKYLVNQERFENIVKPDPNAVTIAPDSERTIINLRVEKKWLDSQLTTYVFGNDIFNEGIEANTSPVFNVTRSQIGAMFGLGLNYKLK